jgi:hypothetical protein
MQSHKLRRCFMLVSVAFVVLSVALFSARIVFLTNTFRMGTAGTFFLGAAYLSLLSAFFVSGEPAADRNGGTFSKQENPIRWYFTYLTCFLAGPIFLYAIWSRWPN